VKAPDPQRSRANDPAAPFLIVMNAGSGHDDAASERAIIERTLREAGRDCRVALVDDASKLEPIARETARDARERGGVVTVAGGDGTATVERWDYEQAAARFNRAQVHQIALADPAATSRVAGGGRSPGGPAAEAGAPDLNDRVGSERVGRISARFAASKGGSGVNAGWKRWN